MPSNHHSFDNPEKYLSLRQPKTFRRYHARVANAGFDDRCKALSLSRTIFTSSLDGGFGSGLLHLTHQNFESYLRPPRNPPFAHLQPPSATSLLARGPGRAPRAVLERPVPFRAGGFLPTLPEGSRPWPTLYLEPKWLRYDSREVWRRNQKL